MTSLSVSDITVRASTQAVHCSHNCAFTKEQTFKHVRTGKKKYSKRVDSHICSKWKQCPVILLCLVFLQLASSVSATFCPHIFSWLNTFSLFSFHLFDHLPVEYLFFQLLCSFHCRLFIFLLSLVIQRENSICKGKIIVIFLQQFLILGSPYLPQCM